MASAMYFSKHIGKKIDDTIDCVCNPNLLDNWYFANPVNQRGATIYNETGYTFDRWRLGNARVSVAQEDGRIRITRILEGNYASLRQVCAENLPAGTYTVSALVDSIENTTASLAVYKSNSTTSVSSSFASGATTTPDMVSFTFDYTPDSTKPYFVFTIGFPASTEIDGTFTVRAVKMELGSQQTLAHQDASGNWVLNEIPDYGEQLEKCKRYFERVKATSNNMTLCMGSGTATDLYVPIQVAPKRANPAAFVGTQITEGVRVGTNLLNIAPEANNVTFYSRDNVTGRYTLLIKGSWTAGTTYRMGLVAGTYLDFNADL